MLVLFVYEKMLIDELHLAYFSLLAHLLGHLGVALFVPCGFAKHQAAEHPLAEQIFPLIFVSISEQFHVEPFL